MRGVLLLTAMIAIGAMAPSASACSATSPCYPQGYTPSVPHIPHPHVPQHYLYNPYRMPQTHLPPTPHYKRPPSVQPDINPYLRPMTPQTYGRSY